MKFKVGVAQMNLTIGDIEKNFGYYQKFIDQAKKEKIDLLIFPELSLTGYFLKDMVPNVALRIDSPIIKELKKISRKLSLVVGFVEETEDYKFYNAAAYLEDGEIKHIHRKVYLPTYGMFEEERYFASGEKIRAFHTKYGRMGILICEDLWHPSSVYIIAQDGAKFIVETSSSPGKGITKNEKLTSSQIWEQINRTYAQLYGIHPKITGQRYGYCPGCLLSRNTYRSDLQL